MARLARVVIPHVPHHVTQRGNRRQEVFFDDSDYAAYTQIRGHNTYLTYFVGKSGDTIPI
jgi:REP element-mobilizing transposase RayT